MTEPAKRALKVFLPWTADGQGESIPKISLFFSFIKVFFDKLPREERGEAMAVSVRVEQKLSHPNCPCRTQSRPCSAAPTPAWNFYRTPIISTTIFHSFNAISGYLFTY